MNGLTFKERHLKLIKASSTCCYPEPGTLWMEVLSCNYLICSLFHKKF